MPDEKDDRMRPVPRDSPLRCQHVGKGQCTYQQLPGSKFCLQHSNRAVMERKDENMYILSKWKDEIARLGGVKDITAEIGVARLTLQQLLQQCEQEDSLLANAFQIMQLTRNITEAIEKWDRIQTRAANTLNRTQALAFVGDVLAILKRDLPPEKLAALSAEIDAKLAHFGGDEDA